MKRNTLKNIHIAKNQKGFTLGELLIVLGIAAAIGIAVLAKSGGVRANNDANEAVAEAQLLLDSGKLCRKTSPTKTYNGCTISGMHAQGQKLSPFQTGTGENTYGKNATLTATNSNTDLQLVYQSGTAEDCAQLIRRMGKYEGIKGTPSCSTADATITIE